jgi:hypothetical protein
MRAVLEEGPTGTLTSPKAGESRLNISVIFTSESATAAALGTAASLADRLGGRITLIVPEVVSYQLPLNEPPIKRAWYETRVCELVSHVPVETVVRFYFCRDKNETLAKVLTPHSLVVLGGARRWWLTPERMLARRLRRLGHEVILTETE